MKLKSVALSIVAAMGAMLPLAARAGLAGQTVFGTYYYPDLGTAYINKSPGNPATISPASSFNFKTSATLETIVTAADTTITVSFDGPGVLSGSLFNGPVLAFGLSDIADVTLDGSTNLAGFLSSDYSFTGDSVAINLAGQSVLANSQIVLDVTTGAVTNVPEPLTLSLLGAGLAGAALLRRRKPVKA
jgi:hypothetical protein